MNYPNLDKESKNKIALNISKLTHTKVLAKNLENLFLYLEKYYYKSSKESNLVMKDVFLHKEIRSIKYYVKIKMLLEENSLFFMEFGSNDSNIEALTRLYLHKLCLIFEKENGVWIY